MERPSVNAQFTGSIALIGCGSVLMGALVIANSLRQNPGGIGYFALSLLMIGIGAHHAFYCLTGRSVVSATIQFLGRYVGRDFADRREPSDDRPK
jgi:hypothetical protein